MELVLNLLYAIVSIGVVGGLFGLILALSEEKHSESVSPPLDRILPGLNCGICGYSTCVAYSEAVIQKRGELDACTPGGKNLQNTLEKFLHLEVNYRDGSYPQVHCRGGRDTAQYAFTYQGLDDCAALYRLFQGDKLCKYACLGMGSCIRVCPSQAITYTRESLVFVDPKKCTSCGICITVCPTGVLQKIPRNADYYIACNSLDDRPTTSAYCTVGCTGCRACERMSPEGGFTIEKNLARINYRRRGERKNAEKACPAKCIVKHKIE